MFQLRSEVATIARACEHLIAETMTKGHVTLTDDECQVLDYYAGELFKVTQTEPAAVATASSVADAAALEPFDIPELWPPCTVAARGSDVDTDS